MTQKNLFESYIAPSPLISRCYTSKVNAFSHLQGNYLYGYLGHMRNITKKNITLGSGHLKMTPLEHRTNEFCDPLVKIVGGFVGSKSQAGSSNHRGREISLWDVIVDKIIETMETPESRQQGSRKSGDPGKKNGKIHKISSYTMIEVGQYGPEAGIGPNFNFNCLEKGWYPPSKTEMDGTVYAENNFPGMGVFNTSEGSRSDSQPQNLASWRSCGTDGILDTAVATCKFEERPVENFNSACPVQQDSDQVLPSNISPTNLLRNEPGEAQESPLPCSFESMMTMPIKSTQHVSTHVLNCSVAVPKHILRPEAAEFTPRIPSRTSLESESDDDSIPVDVLSSSWESQTTSDTFPRPNVQRTLSECSADSDDSFIVFESAEDDPVILSEESDDEDSCSDEDLDEVRILPIRSRIIQTYE